jgi:predicted nucleic acid-binding protein
MTLVFDTSALSQLLNNNDQIVRLFSRIQYDRALIPLATDAEIRYGFRFGNKESANLANYVLFKEQFDLEVVAPNQDTAIIYAELSSWARQHGVSLSNNDIWIASTSIQVGGELFTTDIDFTRLPQVRMAM